eukprot:1006887-Pelagomonas_calceolata.AAC.5
MEQVWLGPWPGSTAPPAFYSTLSNFTDEDNQISLDGLSAAFQNARQRPWTPEDQEGSIICSVAENKLNASMLHVRDSARALCQGHDIQTHQTHEDTHLVNFMRKCTLIPFQATSPCKQQEAEVSALIVSSKICIDRLLPAHTHTHMLHPGKDFRATTPPILPELPCQLPRNTRVPQRHGSHGAAHVHEGTASKIV